MENPFHLKKFTEIIFTLKIVKWARLCGKRCVDSHVSLGLLISVLNNYDGKKC
jgi:hypothetical protein